MNRSNEGRQDVMTFSSIVSDISSFANRSALMLLLRMVATYRQFARRSRDHNPFGVFRQSDLSYFFTWFRPRIWDRIILYTSAHRDHGSSRLHPNLQEVGDSKVANRWVQLMSEDRHGRHRLRQWFCNVVNLNNLNFRLRSRSESSTSLDNVPLRFPNIN